MTELVEQNADQYFILKRTSGALSERSEGERVLKLRHPLLLKRGFKEG